MPTARPRNAEATRSAILAAARVQFGERGYEPTTIRAVAQGAGIDAALVMQYFGSKEGLFRAAAEMDIRFPDLRGVASDRLADVLVPAFLEVWRPDGAFLGVLRAAATSPVAQEALREVFIKQVGPALSTVTVDNHAERAALLGSHLIGVAVTRYVLRLWPLAEMTDERLIAWLRPAVAHYLTEPAP